MKLKKPHTVIKKLNDIFNSRQKRNIKLLFLVFLIASVFQVVGVASVFPFINLVMNPGVIDENQLLHRIYVFFDFQTADSFIIFTGAAMFVLIVLSNVVIAFSIWVKTRFVMGFNHTLSRQLLSVYLSKPYSFFLNRNSTEMGKNILAEVNSLTKYLLMPLFDLVIHSFIIIAMILFLIIIDPLTTAAALVVIGGAYVIINAAVKKKLKKFGYRRLEANRGRFKATSEALSGVKTTKVFGREQFFVSQYSRHSEEFTRLNVFEKVIGELPKYLLEVVAFGGIIILMLVATFSRGGSSDVIPFVSLFAFAGYRMMPALQRIYFSLNRIYYHHAILDTLHRDMYQAEIKLPKSMNALPFTSKIALKDITFWYPNTEHPVLQDISVTIRKNTSVGFVGTTGSGKTTLIDIIMGLLAPQQGEMKVDNTIVSSENIRGWQCSIGYVPQDIFLCDDTISRNIAFGLDEGDIDIGKVKKAAEIAALISFIEEELPEGYGTVIGERGIRLSGGQRQRIGLARALYENPDVLVLDEATSSLDGATEQAVISAIQEASKNRTMIMIAHRLTTVKECDMICLLDKGRIVDSGTYDNLIQNNAKFMKMARIN